MARKKTKCLLCGDIALIKLNKPFRGGFCLNCGVTYDPREAEIIPETPPQELEFEVLLNQRTVGEL